MQWLGVDEADPTFDMQELWISYNPIDKLTGVEKLKTLKVLFMGNCKVSAEKEFQKLAELP